jgi:hypothetical protein
MKCRRIETAIRLDRPAILAEFNDVFSHNPFSTLAPSFRGASCVTAYQL